jgi:hypothetical protein
MNDTEILATGELCEALLASEGFKTVMGQYELSIAADILATKASDKERREELYHALWGARGLLSYMQLNVNAATAIKTPKPPTDDSTTDYHVEEYDFNADYDDEGFPRANESTDY